MFVLLLVSLHNNNYYSQVALWRDTLVQIHIQLYFIFIYNKIFIKKIIFFVKI